MPSLQEIPTLDTAIKPSMNSWSTPPAGVLLLIQEGVPPIGNLIVGPPDDFYLSIDDAGNRLLIQ
jgi:hypothetical protein